jgi:putative transposase
MRGRNAGNTQHLTRGYKVALDPTPAQERLLRSYCGAARFAYNHTLAEITTNLEARRKERETGCAEEDLSPGLSWSAFSLRKRFNGTKSEVAPWSGEVAKHCFDTGIKDVADALANWSSSKRGVRKGRSVGFPRYKSRHRSKLSVSFVELNHQLSWLREDRHHVRLMLPQALRQSANPRVRHKVLALQWVHTHESLRRLYRLVETKKATIQKVTISYSGGRWWASFSLRLDAPLPRRSQAHTGGICGIDLGIAHLATLSGPVPGLTDEAGHIPNPAPLETRMARLQKLDRKLSRATRGSRNHAKLKRRRARLHAAIAQTRSLALHQVTTQLAARFDVLAIEDLNVAGMTRSTLARRILDASFGEFAHQIIYKASGYDHRVVLVDRFYPSSKTCSTCGAVTAKLLVGERVFHCEGCATTIDRDTNAAINLKDQARLALAHEALASPEGQARETILAGLRPERRNGDRRSDKTPALAEARSCGG